MFIRNDYFSWLCFFGLNDIWEHLDKFYIVEMKYKWIVKFTNLVILITFIGIIKERLFFVFIFLNILYI